MGLEVLERLGITIRPEEFAVHQWNASFHHAVMEEEARAILERESELGFRRRSDG